MPAILPNSSAAMCGDWPGPEEPKATAPGLARMYSASSRGVRTGISARTTSMTGTIITIETGSKSRRMS